MQVIKVNVKGDELHGFGAGLKSAVFTAQPNRFRLVFSKKELDWADRNKHSPIKHYMDGLKSLFLKEGLARSGDGAFWCPPTRCVYASKISGEYVLEDHDWEWVEQARAKYGPNVLWFLKPSHENLGAGADLVVGTDIPNMLAEATQLVQERRKIMTKIDDPWPHVLQPHVASTLVYSPSTGRFRATLPELEDSRSHVLTRDGSAFTRWDEACPEPDDWCKFDLRVHFLVVYRPSYQGRSGEVRVYVQRDAYARVCGQSWSRDTASREAQLTNLSVFEHVEDGESRAFHYEESPFFQQTWPQIQRIVHDMFTRIGGGIRVDGAAAVPMGLDALVTANMGADGRPEFGIQIVEVNHRVGIKYTNAQSPIGRSCASFLKAYANDLVIVPLRSSPPVPMPDSTDEWPCVYTHVGSPPPRSRRTTTPPPPGMPVNDAGSERLTSPSAPIDRDGPTTKGVLSDGETDDNSDDDSEEDPAMARDFAAPPRYTQHVYVAPIVRTADSVPAAPEQEQPKPARYTPGSFHRWDISAATPAASSSSSTPFRAASRTGQGQHYEPPPAENTFRQRAVWAPERSAMGSSQSPFGQSSLHANLQLGGQTQKIVAKGKQPTPAPVRDSFWDRARADPDSGPQ